MCLPRAWHRLTKVYLKSRKYRLFLQTQRDFALKSLGIHKGFRRLFALHSACFCEISVIFFLFRYTIRKGWLDLADRIHDDPEAYQDVADHKRLATLFYEPSTRTRLSFESAMLRLGGKVLGFPDAGVSSASKGETVADTIRIISCYADIAAMRHPKEGAPLRASLYSKIPVINAGDGGHSHPTQTLLDMMTIRRRKGRLDNLTIGFCGDLKFGRTVHSLIKSLARYDNVKFVLISPEELRVPDYIINEVLEPRGIPYIETRNLEGALPDLDILYMTRVQRERFFNEEDYIRLRDSYILTAEKLNLAPADMAVLHPLPRVNEITLDVDDDPRAAYFEQAQNGVYVRMALIMTLLGLKDPKTGEVAFEC